MQPYSTLKMIFRDEEMCIQSKETQLLNVLNKIKEVKKVDDNLYAIQNHLMIDVKTFVSKLQGQIEVSTFGELLSKHKKLIEKNEINQQKNANIQNEENVQLKQEIMDLRNQVLNLNQIKSLLFNVINSKEEQVCYLNKLLQEQSQDLIYYEKRQTETEQNIQNLINYLQDKLTKAKSGIISTQIEQSKHIFITEILSKSKMMLSDKTNNIAEQIRIDKQSEKNQFQNQMQLQEQIQNKFIKINQKYDNNIINDKGSFQIMQTMFSYFTPQLKAAGDHFSNISIKNTSKIIFFRFKLVLRNGSLQRQNFINGATESLTQTILDSNQFDEIVNIQIRQCKFIVHRTEFKQIAFEKYLKQIHKLGYDRNDYNTAKEDLPWDCIITKTHVSEGLIKKIYLAKKLDREQEVYVIKSPISGQPYQSFDEALRECRSHLIAKLFMKRYKETCIDMREEKRVKIEVPQIQYSDFLILEEDGKQFWIAERFFKGEFVKYNNNNGFIDDSKSNINNFSQAFSMFTYHESESTMMICDIQGIGPYFTDPAINTKLGGFDETDIGEEGINNYLVNYRGKNIGCEYLDLLDIPYVK